MKNKTPTLEDSLYFAENIENCNSLEEVNHYNLIHALKNLAAAKDADNFKKVCETYVKLEEAKGEDAPYAKLEWLCMNVDNSFTAVGFNLMSQVAGVTRKRLPISPTQKFFQEQYGPAFYKPSKQKLN
jgi:hypothetical protein